MRNRGLTALLALPLLSCSLLGVHGENDASTGLSLQLDESNGDLEDTVYFAQEFTISATHFGFELNPESAVHANGSIPAWTMFRLSLEVEDGTVYSMTQFHGETTDGNSVAPGFDSHGLYVPITYGYSYIFPKLGFYGTCYIPFSDFYNGNDPIPAGSKVVKIGAKHNSKSNSRKQMLTHLFEFSQADVTIPDQSDTWVGDVRVLHGFETVRADDAVQNKASILDLRSIAPDDEMVSYSEGCKMYLRDMTKEEMAALERANQDYYSNWRTSYVTSGQYFHYSPTENEKLGGDALLWEYGDYYEEGDPSLNSYGSLRTPVTTSDWRRALGTTLYVKNFQSYIVSFNVEFQEQEPGGMERWNLNGEYWRKLYAYDVNTGEEFSWYTATFVEVPANFEGWIRIPFGEYNCPSWSQAYPYTDGILDLSKPHTNFFITSQFIKNDGVSFLIDNIGIYYEDFVAGKLFDAEKPSIKDCLEMENYKEEHLNA